MYAAIEGRTVYGIGLTEVEAIEDAKRGVGSDTSGLRVVSCTAAAYHFIEEYGGAPSAELSVSVRNGVMLRSEEP